MRHTPERTTHSHRSQCGCTDRGTYTHTHTHRAMHGSQSASDTPPPLPVFVGTRPCAAVPGSRGATPGRGPRWSRDGRPRCCRSGLACRWPPSGWSTPTGPWERCLQTPAQEDCWILTRTYVQEQTAKFTSYRLFLTECKIRLKGRGGIPIANVSLTLIHTYAGNLSLILPFKIASNFIDNHSKYTPCKLSIKLKN